jgi:hypothetical protein
MKLTIFITATHSYLYCIEACVRRINAAVFHARQRRDIEAEIVILTDTQGAEMLKDRKETVLTLPVEEGGENYKEKAQLLIATLQQRGLSYSVEQGADLAWSVEADILVPYNALSCSLDMLEFDDGWYDVAFVTYPSQSGSAFLGGNGDPMHPIAEDWLTEERDVPEETLKALEDAKALPEATPEEKEAKGKAFQEAHESIRKCPPKGNVFEANAKQWRRRGWLDTAHPGIGKGAVLPTDWTGMGCTLMSRKALASAAFDGYDGRGTQDLFLNWRRWNPERINMCVITHCVCEHVIRKDDGYVHCFAHHEPLGECRGHLRIDHRPFVLGSTI